MVGVASLTPLPSPPPLKFVDQHTCSCRMRGSWQAVDSSLRYLAIVLVILFLAASIKVGGVVMVSES